MNYVNGKIITETECESVMEKIDEMLSETLQKPPLDINIVIKACDQMVKNIEHLEAVKRLPELGVCPVLAELAVRQISEMLNADAIRKRMRLELDELFEKPRILRYIHSGVSARQTIAPLGVLFHITAGNADGLPFVSLLEGLLTGNINIVKLPKEEGGLTVSLLDELFKFAPPLKEYVYVFDYSSKDIQSMERLAKVSDAIVLWGGDDAVRAVRRLADPNTKIIEWGHKISFAYVTKEGANAAQLDKLARHICMTNQLFCSSCQGIFLDTDRMAEVYEFSSVFLPILEKISVESPLTLDHTAELFIQADITLQNYHRRIENNDSEFRLFRGKNCSILALPDSKLEPSAMYRNLWVKPLKRQDIIKLRPYKSYLQTAALLCGKEEHNDLSKRLLQTGIVKISDGFEMSNFALGEAHDGVFTLRSYTKLVSVQNWE